MTWEFRLPCKDPTGGELDPLNVDDDDLPTFSGACVNAIYRLRVYALRTYSKN